MEMKRALKALALVLAITAMSAVASSAAQAAPGKYTCVGHTTCIITSDQETTNEFTVETGIVKCTGLAIAKKTINNEAASVAVHPEYSGCKAFGVAATVNTTGCNYVFPIEVGGATPTEVSCSGTNKITVTPTGIACVVTVGNQSGINGISLANVAGSPSDIKQTISATNITYTETGAGCHLGGGTHANGKYTGTNKITGFEDIGLEGEGAQISIAID
jgi:hypothetical protein